MAQIPQVQNYGIPALDYSGVSNTLSALGQQIGQGLAMREYQRQYQNALPAIENTMRSATAKIQSGDFAGGYAEAVGGLPLMSQNPLISEASKTYLDNIKNVAEFQQSEMYRRAQYSRGGGGGIPAAQEPSINFGQLFPGMNIPIGSDTGMDSEFVGDDFTQGTPEQRESQRAADREFRTYEDADRAAAEGLPRQQDITLDMIEDSIPDDKRKEFDALFDFEKDAVVASVNNDRLPPAQKQAATNQSGVTQDAMPKTSELWKDPRLEKYFPGAVGIAKPSENKELRGTGISFTSRGNVNVSTAPQVTNQEVLDVWGKNKKKLEQALDAMDDANMRKLFDEYKDIFSLRAAAQPEGDEFLVGTESITKQQYEALLTLSNLPVWTNREFTPVVFKEAAAAPATQAAAGGMPAVQAAAPARPVVPETEVLRKQLSVFEEQEVKKTATEKQNRIKQINKEIESLQKGTKIQRELRSGAEGLTSTAKTKRDIERDITKIERLVAERDRLEGKAQAQSSSGYTSQNDVINAVKDGQITREQAKSILQNQFGLQ